MILNFPSFISFFFSSNQEIHHNTLEFSIQDARALKLSNIFGRIEANKQRLNIQEYSLSQTSMERVRLTRTAQNVLFSFYKYFNLSSAGVHELLERAERRRATSQQHG